MKNDELLNMLEARFQAHPERHKGVEWAYVCARLERRPDKFRSLLEMEKTGGEPDVIGHDDATGEIIFADCSPETPLERRNTCYDRAGEQKRKKQGIEPTGNAQEMTEAMGIELMDEAQYHALQQLGEFDLKTSSWIRTPEDIHRLGGALFANRHYGRVFVYYNTTQAFYGARGFRGLLRV